MARLESLIAILDRSKKRLLVAFGLAVLLHIPLTPGLPMLRLAHRLSSQVKDPTPPPPQEVEVELREATRNEERRQQVARSEPVPKGPSIQVDPVANVKFAPSAAAPKPEAEKAADKPADPRKERVKDLGLQGLPNKKAERPAMTLALWFSTLRDNPLGQRLIDLASCDREWKRFIDQGIDPLRDLDAVLVVGPGLFHSGQLTAAVRHGLSPERVRAVMDTLVTSSGDRGKWLRPEVASVRLGRSQRVLLPQQSDLFFITPSKGWEALHKVKEPLGVPSAEGRAASLVLVKPNRALQRVGLTLPKQITELRLEVFANLDQSADIKVELEASSVEAANAAAAQASAQMRDFFSDVWTTASTLRAITGASSGDAPLELAPRLDLELDERTLSGLLRLSQNQTKATLALLSSLLCREAPGKGKP